MSDHNYINPSKKQDLSHLEASAGGEVDHQGWPKNPSISDRECIYLCLENCQFLSGLDKIQVTRLMKEFESGQKGEDVVELISEYPPL